MNQLEHNNMNIERNGIELAFARLTTKAREGRESRTYYGCDDICPAPGSPAEDYKVNLLHLAEWLGWQESFGLLHTAASQMWIRWSYDSKTKELVTMADFAEKAGAYNARSERSTIEVAMDNWRDAQVAYKAIKASSKSTAEDIAKAREIMMECKAIVLEMNSEE